MSSPYYCLSDSQLINRRKFLRFTGSLAAAAAWSACSKDPVLKNLSFPAYPFQLGVASGDPSPDGMVLWTRLAPLPLEGGGMPMEPVEVSWQVADDEAFSKVVQKGTTVAVPDWGHSVHIELEGLRPDRWYWYQFKVGNETSPVGRTRTMPVTGTSPDKLKFAFASCQHYETGYYTAYEHMAREDLDLVVHLGDYIYEGKGIDGRLRKHTGEEIVSVEDYRNRYALYKSDEALQAAHAAAPWLVTWDDHEVDNNYANDISEKPDVSSEQLLQRRANAYKAYYEVMPLRRAQLPHGPNMQLYRRVPFGNLVDFFVLDTRQYRTDQPCGDKNKPPCPEFLNPNNSLLGLKQKDWLMSGMETSKAHWNVLSQQVMMARVDRTVGEAVTYSMDQWPSAEMERQQLVKFFDQAKISNPIVLTGDIHKNWANELIVDSDRLDSKSVATEFVGTSISSSGDGEDQPATVSQMMSENPFVKYHNAERGYVSCQVTQSEWTTHYRTVPYVSRRGAPLNTRASFVVESNRPQLNRVS